MVLLQLLFRVPAITALMMWWSMINIFSYIPGAVIGAPQTHLLNSGCSTYNASNLSSFYANINGTFSDMRGQISNESKHFATAQQARGEVILYSMFQCRNYLSKNDCLGCFNTATTQIRKNCSAGNGARIIYDGCFLRYVSIHLAEWLLFLTTFYIYVTNSSYLEFLV